MPAVIKLIPVEQVAKQLLGPTSRRSEVAWEDAAADWQIDPAEVGFRPQGVLLEIESRRRPARVGQPVEGDLVENILHRHGILVWPTIARRVAVDIVHPRRLANRRI